MQLSDMLRKSIENEDYATVGKVVDRLRFRWNMTRKEIADWVNMHFGLSLPEWEAILQECERHEERGDTKG